jgi:hypothetical protein
MAVTGKDSPFALLRPEFHHVFATAHGHGHPVVIESAYPESGEVVLGSTPCPVVGQLAASVNWAGGSG